MPNLDWGGVVEEMGGMGFLCEMEAKVVW